MSYVDNDPLPDWYDAPDNEPLPDWCDAPDDCSGFAIKSDVRNMPMDTSQNDSKLTANNLNTKLPAKEPISPSPANTLPPENKKAKSSPSGDKPKESYVLLSLNNGNFHDLPRATYQWRDIRTRQKGNLVENLKESLEELRTDLKDEPTFWIRVKVGESVDKTFALGKRGKPVAFRLATRDEIMSDYAKNKPSKEIEIRKRNKDGSKTAPTDPFEAIFNHALEEATTNLSIPLEKHGELRAGLGQLTTLKACASFYEDPHIGICLGALRKLNGCVVSNFKNEDQYKVRCRLAKFFALAVKNDHSKAVALNHCRKTLVELLKQVGRVCKQGETPQEEAKQLQQIRDIYQTRRLYETVLFCLPLDRAKCLYEMKTPTEEVGLGWYAQEERSSYMELGESSPLRANPVSHTITKMYKRLQMGNFFDDSPDFTQWIDKWLEIQVPDRLIGVSTQSARSF